MNVVIALQVSTHLSLVPYLAMLAKKVNFKENKGNHTAWAVEWGNIVTLLGLLNVWIVH